MQKDLGTASGKNSNPLLFHIFRAVGSPLEMDPGKKTATCGISMFRLFCRLAPQQVEIAVQG